MNIFKSKKILVVSHDAGGAEIISSFIKKNNLRCFYKLSGPAVNIFKSKIRKIPKLKECYLRNVQHTINPTGGGFRTDGQPNEIDLTLSFVEHETLNRKDIEDGGF